MELNPQVIINIIAVTVKDASGADVTCNLGREEPLMNLMQSFFDALFRELDTPSNQVGPLRAAYDRATAAIGHAVLGAGFVAVALHS